MSTVGAQSQVRRLACRPVPVVLADRIEAPVVEVMAIVGYGEVETSRAGVLDGTLDLEDDFPPLRGVQLQRNVVEIVNHVVVDEQLPAATDIYEVSHGFQNGQTGSGWKRFGMRWAVQG